MSRVAEIDAVRASELRLTPRGRWRPTTPWKEVARRLAEERGRAVPFRAESVRAAVYRATRA
jgi:hypothetical protein